MDAILIVLIAGAILGASVLMLILVFCGCRSAVLRWFGWLLIIVAIAWIYACNFPIGNFSSPDPGAVVEALIPLGTGIITVYLLRHSRSRTKQEKSATP
jgi:TRAP-type C4-dicarboxylate transport system permease small subunit